jgi:hypothetical protein
MDPDPKVAVQRALPDLSLLLAEGASYDERVGACPECVSPGIETTRDFNAGRQ